MKYWLCITTEENWRVIKDKNIWGVPARHENTIKKVNIGDKLVFYLKQEKVKDEIKEPRIAGIFEVVSEPFRDSTRIFSSKGMKTNEVFPWRVKIKPVKIFDKPLEFKPLIPKLKFIKNKKRWSGHIQGKAMVELPKEDFELISSVSPVKDEEDKSIELYKDKKPSREILESIVANVLERFGFRVETNKMAKAKEGREIEVDVWGIKTIGSTRFYVYASCKNWDKKVDRDVIFSEIGRISNLIQHPHLKIFVCKELTDPARETALIDGFTVIELKEKANSENADEIAKIVYNHLNELFTGIAPPELQRIAKEAKAISEKLKSLVDELDKLTKY